MVFNQFTKRIFFFQDLPTLVNIVNADLLKLRKGQLGTAYYINQSDCDDQSLFWCEDGQDCLSIVDRCDGNMFTILTKSVLNTILKFYFEKLFQIFTEKQIQFFKIDLKITIFLSCFSREMEMKKKSKSVARDVIEVRHHVPMYQDFLTRCLSNFESLALAV